MAGMSLPQNPSPGRDAFKPYLALRRHIRHRRHPRQMRQLHPVLRSLKLLVRLLWWFHATWSDSRFLALLGNPNVMSDSLDKGRQSVFAIFDRLRRPSTHGTEALTSVAPSSTPRREYDGDDCEGDGSVILYGTLVPGEDSEVELAASDITPVLMTDGHWSMSSLRVHFPLFKLGSNTRRAPPLIHFPPENPSRSTQDERPADASQSDTRKEPGRAGWFDTLKEKVVEK